MNKGQSVTAFVSWIYPLKTYREFLASPGSRSKVENQTSPCRIPRFKLRPSKSDGDFPLAGSCPLHPVPTFEFWYWPSGDRAAGWRQTVLRALVHIDCCHVRIGPIDGS